MKQPFKRYSKVFFNLAWALLVLVVCVFLLPRALVFFLPFVIGWLIAAVANPLVHFFEEKLRIRRKAGSAVVIVSVIALVILAAYLLLARLAAAGIGFLSSLPALWSSVERDLGEIGKNLSVFYEQLPLDMQERITQMGRQMDDYVAGIVGSFGTPTVSAVGNFAKNIPNALLNIVMCILSAYFFIAEKETIGQYWQSCIPKAFRDKWHIVAGSLKNAVGGYLKAQLKIELWIFLLMLIGFLLLRIPYGPFVAFLISILDFLPFFGTGAVMIPWALIKILSADYKMAVWLLVIWGVGQLVRQIIQPKIVGDSVGIAPLPTLILLFIGYQYAGVLGMILAVPVGLILINMNRAGVFDTVKTSFRILWASLERSRRFDDEDKEVLKDGDE